MREQCRFGPNAKAAHFLCRHDGDFGQLFGRGVVVDVGVDQKDLAPRQQQAIHGRVRADPRAVTNDLIHVRQMDGRRAPRATNQTVHLAFVQHHGANERETTAHINLGQLLGHPFTRRHAPVGLPEVAVAMVLLDIHHLVVQALAQAQAKLFHALGNHRRTTDEEGPRQPFVHHNLHRAQHAFLFALGVANALARSLLGRRINRLHDGARGIHKPLQGLHISVHVGNRPLGHAAVNSGLGHRRGDLDHQARVKGLGNQVLAAKGEFFTGISRRHHLALLRLGQLGNGVHRRDFHFIGDGARPRIERATEDIREAQDVVDLIGVIGASRGDDRIIAHLEDLFRHDLRRGVGQGQHQRVLGHLGHHFRLEHAACGQAEEDVCAIDDLRQRARCRVLRKLDLVLVHQLSATFVNHTGEIRHINVLPRQPQFDEQVQAGQRCRTSA